VLPEVVTTSRLRLALIAPDEVADMKARRRRPGWHPDFPREDDIDAVSMAKPGDVWASRTIVRGRTTLGTIGFFGPPTASDDGVPETEVGYGLVEEARGWGFATEALRGLLAETDRAGVRIRASVEPENKASLRVLAKCGFTQLRGADPDGNLVMARPLPA
jgi:[ribosomal protein S5]-alanine N-acetyltransferase